MREVQQGITRTGGNKSTAQRKVQMTAPANGRWNKGNLPRGAAKTRDIIQSQRTGRNSK